MNQVFALDDCLKRLAAGESPADVLARYPEHAAGLAPMLAAAAQCALLPAAHLTGPQRLRAKVALRGALAARQARPAGFAWPRLTKLPLAFSLALLLVMAISAAAVASSRPGDMLYPLRVAAERAPVLIRFTPASRAGTELDIADRRLKDLSDHLASAGEADSVALDAVLLGDETAAERALGLAAGERALLAARVAGHAEGLRALAAVAVDPEDDRKLRAAAERAQDIVNSLRDPENGATQAGEHEIAPPPQASPAAAGPTPTPTAAPAHQPATTSTPPTPPATHRPLIIRPPGSGTPGDLPRSPEPALSPLPTRTRPADWTPPPTHTPRPTFTPRPTQTRLAAWTPPPMRTPRPTLTPQRGGTRLPDQTPPPTPPPTRTRPPERTPPPTRTRPAAGTPRAPTTVPTVSAAMPTAAPTVIIPPAETSPPADVPTPEPAATETDGSGRQRDGTPPHAPVSTPGPRSTGGSGPG